jgi:hypothetical protein
MKKKIRKERSVIHWHGLLPWMFSLFFVGYLLGFARLLLFNPLPPDQFVAYAKSKQ